MTIVNNHDIPTEPDTFKARSQVKIIVLTLFVSILICWGAQEAVRFIGLALPLPLTISGHLVYFLFLGLLFWNRRWIPSEES